MGNHDHYHDYHHPVQRKKPSWTSTLVAQVFICLALYAAFNVWMPRGLNTKDSTGMGGSNNGFSGRSGDFYFLTVRGGSRPVAEQTQLLQQMDKVAKVFNAKFVVDLSELGENDPLLQNATLYFSSLRMPWYATKASKSEGEGCFSKRITISHEQTMDIIALNTGSWQELVHVEEVSENSSDQMDWLTRTLAESSSTWRIIVGFHPLVDCEDGRNITRKIKHHDCLHNIFLKHGVNAYLSKLGCAGHYSQHIGIAYLRNPSFADEEFESSSANASTSREKSNGLLLHRVSPLEIESYFINSGGDVVSKHTLPQLGRETM